MISDVMYPKILSLANHFIKLSKDYWMAGVSLKGQKKIQLDGFCTFIKWESKERWMYAENITNFIIKNDKAMVMSAIAAPKNDFTSPQQIMDYLVGLEGSTIGVINAMIGEAIVNKDYNCESYLKWLYKRCVKEQQEVRKVASSLNMYSGDIAALVMKDKELYDEYSMKYHTSCPATEESNPEKKEY